MTTTAKNHTTEARLHCKPIYLEGCFFKVSYETEISEFFIFLIGTQVTD